MCIDIGRSTPIVLIYHLNNKGNIPSRAHVIKNHAAIYQTPEILKRIIGPGGVTRYYFVWILICRHSKNDFDDFVFFFFKDVKVANFGRFFRK